MTSELHIPAKCSHFHLLLSFQQGNTPFYKIKSFPKPPQSPCMGLGLGHLYVSFASLRPVHNKTFSAGIVYFQIIHE